MFHSFNEVISPECIVTINSPALLLEIKMREILYSQKYKQKIVMVATTLIMEILSHILTNIIKIGKCHL